MVGVVSVGQNGGVPSLKERIENDLATAMKAREETKVSTLRMLKSAIQNAEVAGDEAVVLSDDQTIAVLRAEAKKRAESAISWVFYNWLAGCDEGAFGVGDHRGLSPRCDVG